MIVLSDEERKRFKQWLLQEIETSNNLAFEWKKIGAKPMMNKFNSEIKACNEVFKMINTEKF